MFDFKLVHIPGKKFAGPDGLSRRRRVEGEGDGEEDGKEAEDWVEEILMCGVWMAMGLVGKERLWESGEEGTMAAMWAIGRKTILNAEGEEILKNDDGEWKDESCG
jgi:hypothetical protein